MRMPNNKTEFLPLSEIEKYSDPNKYICCGVVFSPETENNHFHGCPPYIEIIPIKYKENPGEGRSIYFCVPEIVAHYAKVHPCYTMAGTKRHEERGADELRYQIASLLKLNT